MSQQTVTKCDGKGCEKVKGEANKWIRVAISLNGVALMIANDPITLLGTSGYAYELRDYCSDACLQKCIGEVLDAIRNVPHEEPVK